MNIYRRGEDRQHQWDRNQTKYTGRVKEKQTPVGWTRVA